MTIKVFCIIACLCVLQSISSAQNMMKDAGSELQTWLEKIPRGQEKQYGFDARSDFSVATLGSPYQLFILDASFFSDSLPTHRSYLLATGEWRIPVLVRGKSITLVTVIERASHWRIVDLGANILARELDEYLSFPDMRVAQTLRMLSVYRLHSDFLFADNPALLPNQISLYPLLSARLNIVPLKDSEHEKKTLIELLSLLREELKQQ
jgi:hypothetical protein